MATPEPSDNENFYILGDSNAEMVHLIETDRTFNKALGGLLPEQSEEFQLDLHNVLDVACGPGGWALELAQAYPDIEVIGFDLSAGMIDYANAQAHASKLHNVRFQVGNAMKPFDFPDASFDLVNIRHIEGVIPTTAWPIMVQEMMRVTRPGGILRITDCEWGVTNSYAHEQLLALAIAAMQRAGLSHSLDGRNYAITHLLSRFLRDVGCLNIQERPTVVDWSTGADNYRGGSIVLTLAYQLMEPFLLGTQVTTPPQIEQLRSQMSLEILDENFGALIYTLTAWGQKP